MHYVLFDHSDDLKLAITNSTMVEIYFLQYLKSSKCIKIMFVSVEVLEKQFSNWKLMIIFCQRISNQSSLGLISPISPTSPGMDWVTITILKMD